MTTETRGHEPLAAELIAPSRAARLPATMPQPRRSKPYRWRRWLGIAAATLAALALAFGAALLILVKRSRLRKSYCGGVERQPSDDDGNAWR